MRMRLIWIGKTKNEQMRALVDDYLGRLTHFVRCEVTELRESSGWAESACLEEEGKRIADALRSSNITMVLDANGQQWSSLELAAEIERWQTRGVKEAAFVIGGHFGLAPELKRRVGTRSWSLSRLTLTHEMTRVVLVEQLYRAYTIIRGLPYQK